MAGLAVHFGRFGLNAPITEQSSTRVVFGHVPVSAGCGAML